MLFSLFYNRRIIIRDFFDFLVNDLNIWIGPLLRVIAFFGILTSFVFFYTLDVYDKPDFSLNAVH